MPAELKAKLEEESRSAGRSLTQEIISRLQGSLEPPPTDLGAIGDRMHALEEQIKELTSMFSAELLRSVKAGEVTMKDGQWVRGPNYKAATKKTAAKRAKK